MAKTYRFPALVIEDRGGLFHAILLDKDTREAAMAGSAKTALDQLGELLSWQYEEWLREDEPAFLEPKILDIRIQVRPEYKAVDATEVGENEKKKVFPCEEQVALTVPCVYGRESGGMHVGVLPTLNVWFNYYEAASLKSLAAHYALEHLSGRTPLELAAYLSPKSRVLREVVVTVKGSARKKRKWGRRQKGKETEALASVAEAVISRALRGKFAKACGREAQVEDLMERLRTKRANVVLVGEAGVGKTAILVDAARQIEQKKKQAEGGDESPCRLWMTTAHRIVAGMRFLGQWQERCEELVRQLSREDGILCVENLLDLVKTGGMGPVDSIASFFIPYMKRGELALVGECTPAELDACRRMLPGFADLFQVLNVPAFTETEAKAVLHEMSTTFSQNLHIQADRNVVDLVYRLFSRFMPYSAFPGRAVMFLFRLFEEAQKNRKTALSSDAVLDAFVRQTGLPHLFLKDDLVLQRHEVLEHFQRRIMGQESACGIAADIVVRFKAGMHDPARPIAVLLFCGPTGVGKTALAKALAEYFFSHGEDKDRLIRLDMSEYGTPGSARRLIGGPDDEPSDLIKRMRRQPFSVLLLDEIEKAHPEVFDVFLNVFDEGRLTDPFGRLTTFRSAVIIMTSNLGARQQGSLGFGEQAKAYEGEVMSFFRPEFFNRIDSIVTFASLGKASILDIARKELTDMTKREGVVSVGLRIRWTDELLELIAARGFDARYGARPLQRTIEERVVIPLARLLAEHPEICDCEIVCSLNDRKETVVSVTGGGVSLS